MSEGRRVTQSRFTFHVSHPDRAMIVHPGRFHDRVLDPSSRKTLRRDRRPPRRLPGQRPRGGLHPGCLRCAGVGGGRTALCLHRLGLRRRFPRHRGRGAGCGGERLLARVRCDRGGGPCLHAGRAGRGRSDRQDRAAARRIGGRAVVGQVVVPPGRARRRHHRPAGGQTAGGGAGAAPADAAIRAVHRRLGAGDPRGHRTAPGDRASAGAT